MDIRNIGPAASMKQGSKVYTVCPRSSDPFYIVTYYIKWVTTSWTDSNIIIHNISGF